ncbi:hypothetical protein V5O48_010077 [Marasmius crinis-equi]|uniref:T6SS Phospholipase effector Tle1-like catalytic domain-containing protein n=1 Tax=Marasmius crinis-equi TaxID=585013 RepID=A0ABR3F9A8_9AGAR
MMDPQETLAAKPVTHPEIVARAHSQPARATTTQESNIAPAMVGHPNTDSKVPVGGSTDEQRPLGVSLPPEMPASCHRHGPLHARNLVVCIDGTANQFGRKNTNVVELYSRLTKHPVQLTYYNSGIGTYAIPSWRSWDYYKQVVGHVIDLAIAFKRDDRNEMAARFKETFCHSEVTIHFVGAWDTVSSIGVARRKADLPVTNLGMKHVCYFRHALALDERRVKFLPEYAQGGAGPVPVPEDEENFKKGAMPPYNPDTTKSKMCRVKEVWFAGTHSDIGGGNTENANLIRNGPSLRWMVTEAKNAGLIIKPSRGEWGSHTGDLEINESMNVIWRFLEVLPLRRLTYRDAKSTTSRPHFGQRREIVSGQLIHESVYRTKDGRYLERLPSEASKEIDPIDRDAEKASIALKTLLDHGQSEDPLHKDAMETLQKLVYGETGTRAVLADLSYMLFDPQAQRSLSMERARVAMQVMIKLRPSEGVARGFIRLFPPIIRDMLNDVEYRTIAREFIHKYAIFVLTTAVAPYRQVIGDVTFCADGRTIACATPFGGAPGAHGVIYGEQEGFRFYKYFSALSVAYWSESEGPGKLAIATSQGLRTGDLKSLQVGSIIDTRRAIHVSFSADGEQMLSCFQKPSHIQIIQLWRAVNGGWTKTHEFQPDDERFCFIYAAFSPSGREVVAAGSPTPADPSQYGTVYVLSTDNGTLLYGPITVTPRPMALEFSRSGDTFYTAGRGGIMQGWDTQKGTSQNIPPFRPTDPPYMDIGILALSPTDGTTMLVGSESGIRFFDMRTGIQLGETIMDEPGRCAAWAPDGKSVVVGTAQGKITVYDATPDGEGLERVIKEGREE